MKIKSRKYLSFTLIEMLLVTVIIGFIFPIMISVYSFMINSNKQILARQAAIQQGYEFFERLNILMQDYTVDYEEYYNRQMVGCVNSGGLLTGEDFKWNTGLSGYCTEFTAYGNENSTDKQVDASNRINTLYHNIYYCSSTGSSTKVEKGRPRDRPVVVGKDICGKYGDKQSFGQYKALFIDALDRGKTTDDEDVGTLMNPSIQAIRDSDNIQEIYLISHDGKNRMYLRRKLVPETVGGSFVQYKIQTLRLKGFDAGSKHNFDDTTNGNEGLYDGKIDTWVCDTSMGFVGHGDSIGGAYLDYNLPADEEDCWVDLTYGSTNAYTWNISISPLGDSTLFWADEDHQINPYMKILLVNGVYFPSFSDDASIGSSIEYFKVPIETTINMKDFYKE